MMTTNQNIQFQTETTSHWILLFSPFFLQYILLRWILSRTFKDDINTDYGIYPENGDDIVMEAVDRNTEYEQQEDQAIGRQVSQNENEYDHMYEPEPKNE